MDENRNNKAAAWGEAQGSRSKWDAQTGQFNH